MRILSLTAALVLGLACAAGPVRAAEAAAAAPATAATVLSVDPQQSSVTYVIVHKLHKVSGTSRKVEGKGRILPDGKAQVMVRVPVESFDSQNANRDAHMKEAVEAAKFPTVELKAATGDLRLPTTFPSTVDKTFQAELTFHGIKKTLEVPVHLVFEAPDRVRATAKFPVSLDGHKVERPSLMFVKVDDAAQIDVTLLFKT